MIATALSIVAWGLALAVLAPAALLFLQTAASFLPRRVHDAQTGEGTPPGRVAILIPAHNEGAHIEATVRDALAGLAALEGARHRLIVIADNCADDTAAVAEALGADVVVRRDPDRRGKGYALQFGIDHLRADPPDSVVFLDADCRFEPGVIARLAAAARASARPAQALYIMEAPDGAPPRLAVAAFAWLMINRVRMSGLYNLADVTRFTGSGMAAPWAVISGLDLATGAITEDLLLTFKMTEAGAPPLLETDALVTSAFPQADEASVTQRARWEHGSLALMARLAAPALGRGLAAGDFRRVMLALDLMIPPLIMFALFIAAAALAGLALSPFVGAGPFLAALAAAGLFAVSVMAGWAAHGRGVLPPSRLVALAPFLLEKLRIYGGRGRASSKTWTRTKRQGEEEEGG